MSGSVNKVILVGNLGKDPEEMKFANGGSAVKFAIATSERWTDKASGEKKEKTEWHNIVIYNENLGRIAMQYLKKGSSVYIEGQLQTRKWQDKEGHDKYTTEVVLQRFRGELTLLGSRGGSSEASNDDFGAMANDMGGGRAKVATAGGSTTHGKSGFGGNDLDDEIPF